MKPVLAAISFLLCLPVAAQADHPELLDAVPRNVRGSLSIHNLDRLKEKGNKLLNDLNRQNQFELGQLYEMGLGFLGIRNGIDRTGTFSIILADWGLEKPRNNIEWEYLLVRVPFSDADKMADNFSLPKGSLAPGKIHTVRSKLRGDVDSFLGSDEHAIYLGLREDAVRSALNAGKLSEANIVDNERRIADSDLLFHMNIAPFRNESDTDDLANMLRPLAASPESARQLAEELLLKSQQFLLGGTVDDGMHFRTQVTFGRDLSEPARKQLESWSVEEASPSLTALPEGNLLLALSRTRNRAGSADLPQLITHWFVRHSWEANSALKRAKELFDPAQGTLLGVFEELLSAVNQARSGAYFNEDVDKHGLVAMISIVEPQSPAEFDKALQDVLKYARGTNYNPATKEETKITDAEIRQLVTQLGDGDFRTRRAATFKLKLLGDPAVPELRKALESPDREVQIRSQKLLAEIEKSLAERQAALAERNLKNLPLPTFVMYPAHTEIEGCKVDLIEARWDDADENTLAEINSVLGPQAREILLAHVGNQRVISIGSNRELLKETLLNLKHSRAGLEDRAKLFRNHDSMKRNAELHISLQKLQLLFPDAFPRRRQNPDPPETPTDALTSIDVEVAPTHLLMDFSFPVDELKVLNSVFGIW